jgi:hypothetical protein
MPKQSNLVFKKALKILQFTATDRRETKQTTTH